MKYDRRLTDSRDRRGSTASQIPPVRTVHPVPPSLLLPCDHGGFLAVVAEFELGAAGEADGV